MSGSRKEGSRTRAQGRAFFQHRRDRPFTLSPFARRGLGGQCRCGSICWQNRPRTINGRPPSRPPPACGRRRSRRARARPWSASLRLSASRARDIGVRGGLFAHRDGEAALILLRVPVRGEDERSRRSPSENLTGDSLSVPLRLACMIVSRSLSRSGSTTCVFGVAEAAVVLHNLGRSLSASGRSTPP